MARSACTQIGKPIEITSISSGSTIDYQFDVPADGNYTLTLLSSGYGEPTRFDPSLSLCAVNADGSRGQILCDEKDFTLPNADDVYTELYLPCTLKAGRQTLRVVGGGKPSGLRVAGVSLNLTSGIDSVVAGQDSDASAPVDVFNLCGQLVKSQVPMGTATDGLPAGIYVAGGKKLVVR